MAICDSSSESWIADFGCVHEFTTQPEDTPGAEASEAADICEITRSDMSQGEGPSRQVTPVWRRARFLEIMETF
jgi:hypothetical protein